MSLPTPNTRKEQYLNAIATGNTVDMPAKPITREEAYLDAIAKNGGGSGDGDMKKSVYDSDLDVANAGGIKGFVNSAVAGKVDKVEGKGLSTNDYDDTEKGKVADNTSAIEAITEYGAKNLAPILDFTQEVIQGITWTVYRENGSNHGKVYVAGTANGYSTARTKDFFLPAGTYIISDGASTRNSYVEVKKSSDASIIVSTLDGDSKTFTLSDDATVFVLYVVKDGITIYDTFSCMIRDARITDSTYVPYAMTNKQLTDEVEELTDSNAELIKSVTSISSQLGKAEIYLSTSYDTTSVTFTGIKIKNQSRYPALFIGNGNGTPFMAACALYTANITDVTISDSNMTIAVSNVTDTTYDLTIGGINTWGYYALAVFYH